MILYHGSTTPVQNPKILKSERMLDFGEGFYTTANEDQAHRWSERVAARRGSGVRVITEYDFDLEAAKQSLAVVFFDTPDEKWLDFVCQNRTGRLPSETYDIVVGPVADDQVFATVTLYEQGLISKAAAITELKVRKLYNQVLFHSEESLAYCKYIRHIEIGGQTVIGKR